MPETKWPPLKDTPEPKENLVEWAEKNALHLLIKKPWDRPWWNSAAPPGEWDVWERPCRCSRMVKMKRKPLEDNDGSLWLGQCETCEAFIWAVKIAR